LLSLFASIVLAGTLLNARLFANSIIPSWFTVPGVPIPTLSISAIVKFAALTASSQTSAISSKISSALLGAFVGVFDVPIILYSSSTTDATIFVPPKSIPIVYIFLTSLF